tara:strand:- start:9261 stop:9692 length:432 start_codon:yes stop_codon:yes gene_type:complete
MKIKELALGDILYHSMGFQGLGQYKVVGIRTSQDATTQYEVECQACADHTKCRLLVTQTGARLTTFRFVSMTNNHYEEDSYDTDQTIWHDDGDYYYLTKKVAFRERLAKILKSRKDTVSKLEAQLKKAIESQKEIETLYNDNK